MRKMLYYYQIINELRSSTDGLFFLTAAQPRLDGVEYIYRSVDKLRHAALRIVFNAVSIKQNFATHRRSATLSGMAELQVCGHVTPCGAGGSLRRSHDEPKQYLTVENVGAVSMSQGSTSP